MTIAHRIICHLTVVLLLILPGCARWRDDGGYTANDSYTNAHYHRAFTLSRTAPHDAATGITLVDVHSDGVANIRAENETDLLTTRPGGYYVCDEFGRHGLQLVSSSPKKRSATFLHTWADDR